jgi:hypothetical protein
MTEDPHDEEYLGLFKPKSDAASAGVSQDPGTGPGESMERDGEARIDQPMGDETSPPKAQPEDIPTVQAEPLRQHPGHAAGEADDLQADWSSSWSVPGTAERQSGRPEGLPDRAQGVPLEPQRGGGQYGIPMDPVGGVGSETRFDAFITSPDGPGRTLRTVGAIVGGGCLLLMLLAVVLFAFYQVFVRRGGDDEVKDTPTPTVVAVSSPTPVATLEAVADSPLFVPLVNSDDVRVPLALPERLTVGDTVYTVQAQRAPEGAWPAVPTAGDTVAWVYGTVVNYILGLAPTSENSTLVSALQAGDTLSLHMSTGLILDFNVGEIAIGAADEAGYLEQISPRLTLALLTDDPARRIVVSAPFFNDEAGEPTLFSEAAVGLVGTLVNQGPVRVTVIEAYQVAAGEAGLPAGTGYLLTDLKIENVGQTVLEPEFFQTFVIDTAGERFPLTMLAEQFAHYGIPTESLAPGETVIGSMGYLVSRSSEGEVRWAFNPLPGSDHWIIVPLSFDLPLATPTAEPPPVGFARVTVDTDDVFIDKTDGLLDIGLRIENISDGVVQVTESDISLSSWTDGELPLVAPAPPLPWAVEPRELELFQLQFELPTADSALLEVLGHTFSIENLGGE